MLCLCVERSTKRREAGSQEGGTRRRSGSAASPVQNEPTASAARGRHKRRHGMKLGAGTGPKHAGRGAKTNPPWPFGGATKLRISPTLALLRQNAFSGPGVNVSMVRVLAM